MATSIREAGIVVEGLAELQRAFKRVSVDTAKDLRGDLKGIADLVRDRARANAPRRSDALSGSIRSSATQKGASIYSNMIYAKVQDLGGRVGRKHATYLTGSRYMTGAVDDELPEISHRLDGLLTTIGQDFEK